MIASAQTRHSQMLTLDRRIEVVAGQPPLDELVGRLRVLKGIDTLSAATIAAEVGDFNAFAHASSFMAYVGLVPREHSSGQRERRGSITKTGNAHLRRVLVEAAWAYRHRPAVGAHLRRRQADTPANLVAYSWHVQQRLHHRYRSLAATKHPNVAVVGVARELAGFAWALMTERYPR